MTAEKQRSYRFATEAQWGTCLTARADAETMRSAGALRPLTPYAHPGLLHESRGAHAPVVTLAGEILWVDDQRALHRMLDGDDEPVAAAAPLALTAAKRIVATSSGLWVLSAANALESYDEESLTRRLVVELPDVQPVDIAADGRDSVFALVDDHGDWKVMRIDRGGHVLDIKVLAGLSHAEAFVFVRRARRFAVLGGESHQRLTWFGIEEERPLFRTTVGALRPCFAAGKLGTDGRDRILLAGADRGTPARSAHVLILDADGNFVGDVPLDRLDAPPSGVVATKNSLLVTGSRGLLQFGATEYVPEGAGQSRTTLVTPMLYSPDREDGRRWLRVDTTAQLPEGSSIEIAVAATDDAEMHDRLNAIAANDSMTASQRVDRLMSETGIWRGRTTFAGTETTSSVASAVYSAKLFDVREQYLWIAVTLSASPGARLPLISELNVLYPGLTLMEKLPSIYQREEEQPDSFLRSLVGVLETTTQGIDARIASMGGNVHPSRAPEPWLDYIARWLGVPWDDGLEEAQKRAIVTRASELAKGRGTRAGLEALLECLLPGAPRRFRVTDATADHGFAIIGGESCAGSALPAMLGGRTRWSAELDSRAVLGFMRLPCAAQLDDGARQLAGNVRIEVAATSMEREAWEPWFRALVTEMIPVTAKLDLRWVSPDALRTETLDGIITIKSAPAPHLGVDAVTALARLPERGTRLSASGSNIRKRLS
jgi:phage tail-like protein